MKYARCSNPLPATNKKSIAVNDRGHKIQTTIATGAYRIVESTKYRKMNGVLPPARFANRFHVACKTAAMRTSARASGVNHTYRLSLGQRGASGSFGSLQSMIG